MLEANLWKPLFVFAMVVTPKKVKEKKRKYGGEVASPYSVTFC
jgi:hypothetical protein